MITQTQVQQIMYRLRCTAERDPNDDISNAASRLAFALQTPSRINSLDDAERQLIAYAFKKKYLPLKANKGLTLEY